MPRKDRTYSASDCFRIFKDHLSEGEQEICLQLIDLYVIDELDVENDICVVMGQISGEVTKLIDVLGPLSRIPRFGKLFSGIIAALSVFLILDQLICGGE